jgi:dipeptidyl aminopeptidase/acylaminoacyl peptidase
MNLKYDRGPRVNNQVGAHLADSGINGAVAPPISHPLRTQSPPDRIANDDPLGGFQDFLGHHDGGVRLANHRLVAAAPGSEEFIEPRFSPDGRRIAFQRLQNRQWDIWVMNLNGGAQTRLTFDGGACPNWASDGRRIAFKSQRRTGNTEIYVMDVSSTAGLQ